MKLAITASAAVLALLCTGGAAGAPLQAVASLPAAIQADATPGDAHWFDGIAGRKLVGIDGSTILLSPSDGGLALEIAVPGGNARNLSFSFMTDALGSVSDAASKMIGVFRQSANGIEAQFADGHSETFAVNSSGGVSLTLSDAAAKAYCVSWYPEGHEFGDADRKAALAAYATRLGLPAAQKPVSACSSASPTDAVAHGRPRHSRIEATNAPAQTILVRTSQVHLIDAAPLAPQPAVQQVASAPVPLPNKASSQNHSASTCLSVDSDGANWGFRNGCAFNVQVAYCLMNGSDKSTACGIGVGSSSVPANGFVSVLSNSAIVTADQEFRWIGCTGGSKDVTAHLDRTDPPAGRCVALRGS